MFRAHADASACSASCRQSPAPEAGIQEKDQGAEFSGWLIMDPEGGSGA